MVLLALIGSASVAMQTRLQEARRSWPRVEGTVLVPSPTAARILALGYRELVADLFWARTLVYYGGGLSEGLSLTYVDPLIKAVNGLDPRFRRPYRWGAFATTYKSGQATQQEFWASVRILERGIAAFPDDHELLWLLGLRYAYDLEGKDDAEQRRFAELGATYMERAMRAPGAPSDLAITAANMRTRLGQTDRAMKELEEMILNTTDARARAPLEARFRELAGSGIADAIAEEAARFEAQWKATLPFAPASLHVLLGPRPGTRPRLADLAAPPEIVLPLPEEP